MRGCVSRWPGGCFSASQDGSLDLVGGMCASHCFTLVPQNHARGRSTALQRRANKADGNGRMHAACVHHAFMCASARLPPWRTSPAAAVSGIGLIAESPRHTRKGRTHGQQEFMQACSRSTAVGSPSMADAAKQWRGLSSSLLLNLSIFSYGWREIRSTHGMR